MRDIQTWLDEYGASHRNSTNKTLHWICVPVIVWCVIGLLWSVPVPQALGSVSPWLNLASLVVAAALGYYAALSPALALGALPVLGAMLWSVGRLAAAQSPPLLATCIGLFIVAWIGQFIGHAIEGKRPSFFKDMQFLLIGPLWLLAALYRRLNLPY